MASVLGYAAMGGGVLGLILLRCLLSPALPVVAAQAGALALMVWARVTFGGRSFHLAANPTHGGLVTTGPYRFVRHPIYTAACWFVWAGVAAHHTWPALALGVLITAGSVVRMLCEERLVTQRYPEYRQYAAKTRRMIPYLF